MPKLRTNTLYYGDNLDVLRHQIPNESIDLIYLDPPFNSNRAYNVLFKEAGKAESPAQIEAFEDTWHPGDSANHAFEEVSIYGSDDTARLLNAMLDALGHNDVTAYLSMMAVRLIEMHRALKSTGSIFLHCDPTASHYLKVLMDSIFGPANFVNEIIWKRQTAHNDIGQGAKHLGRLHDSILLYCKSDAHTWNQEYQAYDEDYADKFYRHVEPESGRRYQLSDTTAPGGADPAKRNPHYEFLGVTRYWRFSETRMKELYAEGRIVQTKPGTVPRQKRYLDEMPGVSLQSVWTDVLPLQAQARERLGYPTQKPLDLLERIVKLGSNPGDVVLDPFCGCGTAVHAAQKLGRLWIGIDVTHLAIGLVRRRMEDAFPELKGKIQVIGEPVDLPGAQELAERDKYQFQWWVLDRIGASPAGGDRKKGMDRGIDGVIPFMEGVADRRRVIVSVKGGAITSAHVRDLKGVLDREDAPIGVFLTLRSPTREMRTEAAAAGSYKSERWGKSYPRIQILTVADVLNGKRVNMPPQVSPFAEAPRETRVDGRQTALEI
ncbi:MAG: site-specific DNA-methyltransferase [Chloroflexota bacterium]|nr:site-specific DNA-methyltransferase [Chloroflexota bacterium]